MKLNFSPAERDLISICKVRHDAGANCKHCIYNGKICTDFFENAKKINYELKEIFKNGKR